MSELPKLPEPDVFGYPQDEPDEICSFSSDAMRAYGAECARLAVLAERADWQAERANVLRMLRDLCAEFGSNDWPDELDLGDVLETFLAPYLEELVNLERERCAKLCDSLERADDYRLVEPKFSQWNDAVSACAADIRAQNKEKAPAPFGTGA